MPGLRDLGHCFRVLIVGMGEVSVMFSKSWGCVGLLVLLFLPDRSHAQNSLDVSVRNLTFTAARAGDAPPKQYLSVTSAVSERAEFTADLEPYATANWLSVNPKRGTTPARLEIAIDQTGLRAGEYAVRLIVQSGDKQIPVEVKLSVEERAPALGVAPEALTFNRGFTSDSGQSLLIENEGSGPLPYKVSVVAGAEWLSVSPNSGTTAPNQPGVVRVAVNQTRPTGVGYGVVRVEAAGQAVDVPVVLLLESQGPILSVNLTGLKFDARQGEGYSNDRNLLVLNAGDGELAWQAEVLFGNEWLSLTMPNGRARQDSLGRLRLNAEPGELAPGAYYGLVRISASGAAHSPQYVSAVLNIRPKEATPLPDLSPQGLFFASSDGTAPQEQRLQVFVSSIEPVQYQASASTTDGANWLRVVPENGTTSTDAVAELRVSVNTSILKPGIYTGDVTAALANRTTRTTNITLVVPPGTGAATQAKIATREAGCTPAKLSLTHTGVVNSFESPAGWPNALIVRLADDCGGPVLDASVVATLSSNDPPLSMKLTNPQVGLYSATWTPRSRGNVVITATASAPGLESTRSQIIGSVTESQEAPQVYTGSITSIFHPVAGQPLAPGMPVQTFGESLSSGSQFAESIPLPMSLAGTSLLIGSSTAPLFFASPDQVNAQIPAELTPGTQYSTVILSGKRYSVVDPIVVATARPALVTSNAAVVAQHSDSSPVSNDVPAKTGEDITLLATGLGATDPLVPSGTVPRSSVTAQVRSLPRVRIGGADALVRAAVLSHDLVGIYRVTVQIPAGLEAGNAAVEIEQEGAVSNQASIRVVR
jgi:uncharacterized protein (TIGR03437 family)